MSPPVCSPRCEGNLAISAAANSSLLRVKNGSGGIGGATGGAGGKGSGGRGGALWAVSALGAAAARLDVICGSGASCNVTGLGRGSTRREGEIGRAHV